MPFQVLLRRFGRAPIGSERRKLAHHESLDVRLRRFLVVKIGADISNVGISEADNLTGITGIGENFLVTGEAGVENNFSAAARDGAGGAAVKDAPVFQREGRGSVLNFGQWGLP